jgi:hypothetical protein
MKGTVKFLGGASQSLLILSNLLTSVILFPIKLLPKSDNISRQKLNLKHISSKNILAIISACAFLIGKAHAYLEQYLLKVIAHTLPCKDIDQIHGPKLVNISER